jgi:ABC-type polysaccharide/polyol phosphate transport system ATPase subunit
MLGMSLAEVSDKFDEIVSFAKLENFREMQLKRYSPGMQVRLAFSIAAHYKPEVLVLDEILAVLDAEFQARCLEKIDELKRQGVTLLFVSHDLKKMQRVCDRTIWLEKGILKMDDQTSKVHAEYLSTSSSDVAAA